MSHPAARPWPFRVTPERNLPVRRLFSAAEVERWEAWGNPLLNDALSPDERRACDLVRRLENVRPYESATFLQDLRRGEVDVVARAHHDPRLIAVLYARAENGAKIDGELWNPLLDTFTEVQLEPWVFEGDSAAPLSTARTPVLGDLSRWVAEQRDPAGLAALARARAPMVQSAIASGAKVFNERLVGELLAAHPMHAATLARNAHLDETGRGALLDWIRLRVRNEEMDAPAGQIGFEATALLALHETDGYQMDSHTMGELMTCVHKGTYRLMRERMDCRASANHSWMQAALLICLLPAAEVEEADFRHVVRACLREPTLRPEALRSRSCTLRMKGEALATCRGKARREVEEILLRDDAALADAGIRTLLLESESSRVLLGVLQHATPEEVRRIVRSVGPREPRSLLTSLRRCGDGAMLALRPEDLAPLLSSDDPRTRVEAVRLLGRLVPVAQPSRSGLAQ